MDRVRDVITFNAGKNFAVINIVVVDDEADTHLLYKLKFKKLFAGIDDLHLTSFLGADECLSYLKNEEAPKVDLILSDINMPKMDGFELLSQIRQLKKEIPVYIVSAYESLEYRTKAESLGAKRFISKPVDFRALGDMLKEDFNWSMEHF